VGELTELTGLPRPMAKPLVPSGILGPFALGLVDTSPRTTLLDGDGGESRPRPVWF